ncbi:hypothetical protein [Mycolicibacterium holsaticum]|uniref:hypothetical protein n=1 Tax=Mycolicibacterium holsaticum TaxID=152142 RepID=UPI001C7D8DD4|nr:hypothetical protein [Mycolicibacterium holsaticum]MDA4109274.1 hypothetical protein [Mycolicibacterium holsaticum DSM 44478 = JCM 12374]MDQ2636694.1 hypothetical protein [Actinomycetota bacterium]QZA11664.1 hypothetical protein K3U96_21085 [Mycolicibacterium holsaticum DSM 44478 = JCM 12374]UNC10849.1 hypothetical protein H5U41_05745 [Mycolicibacterium holsaticum DSM 44478 = JCM 12374]
MVLFYIGAAIGAVLAVTYLTVATRSFLRIRRELLDSNHPVVADTVHGADTAEEVSMVPGFSWKASLAVATSFIVLVVASYTGLFWYVLAFSGLGTAAAVIVAFVLELRADRVRGLAP